MSEVPSMTVDLCFTNHQSLFHCTLHLHPPILSVNIKTTRLDSCLAWDEGDTLSNAQNARCRSTLISIGWMMHGMSRTCGLLGDLHVLLPWLTHSNHQHNTLMSWPKQLAFCAVLLLELNNLTVLCYEVHRLTCDQLKQLYPVQLAANAVSLDGWLKHGRMLLLVSLQLSANRMHQALSSTSLCFCRRFSSGDAASLICNSRSAWAACSARISHHITILVFDRKSAFITWGLDTEFPRLQSSNAIICICCDMALNRKEHHVKEALCLIDDWVSVCMTYSDSWNVYNIIMHSQSMQNIMQVTECAVI